MNNRQSPRRNSRYPSYQQSKSSEFSTEDSLPQTTPDHLRELGLDFEWISLSPAEIEAQGYKKLPAEVVSQFSTFFQYIPSIIAEQCTRSMANANTKQMLDGAYKVIIKDGMHLAKSKATAGAFRATLLSDSTNQIAGQAELVGISSLSLSRAPQVALGVFNILSAVTGQYYLSEIHNSISEIEKKSSLIYSYLEDDKRSRVIANQQTIERYIINYPYIKLNTISQTTALLDIKAIQREQRSNIVFYRNHLKNTLDSLRNNTSADEIKKAVNTLGPFFFLYWACLDIYCKAVSLEVLLSEIDDPGFLENISQELSNYKKNYIDDYKRCAILLNDCLMQAEKEGQRRTELVAAASGLSAGALAMFNNNIIVKITPFFAQALITGLTEYHNSKELRETQNAVQAFLDSWNNMDSYDGIISSINEYKDLQNNSIAFIQTSDGSYIKYLTEQEPSL